MNRGGRAQSILHVTDAYFPERGGVETVVENLAAQQVRAGRLVMVLCKNIPHAPIREIRDGVDIRRYERKPTPTPLNYTSSILGSTRAFNEILSERRIDVVHCHLTLSAQGPMSIASGKGIALVGSFYGPWDLEFLAETKQMLEQASPIYRLYLKAQMAVQRKLQSRFLRQMKRLIVLSQYSVSQAARLAPDLLLKLVQIPGGVRTERFFPGDPSNRIRNLYGIDSKTFLIFTLRRLVERMGVDLLIDAVRICLDKGLDVAAIIGGHGPLRRRLEDQVHGAGLSEKIVFAGMISDDDLPDAYREADLFVLPTRSQENFGLPILEAASCATPVIGTPIGSIPEVLGELAPEMIIDGIDAAAIAKKIEWVLKNRARLKKRFTKIARTIPARYDWAQIARQVDAVYDKVIF